MEQSRSNSNDKPLSADTRKDGAGLAWLDAEELLKRLIKELVGLQDIMVTVATKLHELLEVKPARKTTPRVTLYLEARRTVRRKRKRKT